MERNEEETEESLDDFIQSTRSFLRRFCDDIGWQYPSSSRSVETASASEQIQPTKFDNELSGKREATTNELFPPSFDDNKAHSVQLSQSMICDVLNQAGQLPLNQLDTTVPKSSSDLQITFTPSQRLALYEHVIELTKDKIQSLPLTEIDLAFEAESEYGDSSRQEKSKYDMLCEERNAKRRRINYKQVKKVHTKNKSHTEVMAEVISNQMEMYQEWLKAHDAKKEATEPLCRETKVEQESLRDPEHSSRKRRYDRSRSPESHHSHHKHGKKHHKEKSKKRSRSRDGERDHGKHKKHKKSKK